jgi:hypothetical protein
MTTVRNGHAKVRGSSKKGYHEFSFLADGGLQFKNTSYPT